MYLAGVYGTDVSLEFINVDADEVIECARLAWTFCSPKQVNFDRGQISLKRTVRPTGFDGTDHRKSMVQISWHIFLGEEQAYLGRPRLQARGDGPLFQFSCTLLSSTAQ